jgi:hypothetical protein
MASIIRGIVLSTTGMASSYHHAHYVIAFGCHRGLGFLALLIPRLAILAAIVDSELNSILFHLILSVLASEQRGGIAAAISDLLTHPAEVLNGLPSLLMNQNGTAVRVGIVIVTFLRQFVESYHPTI